MAAVPVSWITPADVAGALGIPPATAGDDAWLVRVTGAANAWAFRVRATAGYVDVPDTAPGDDAALGTVLYAEALYRERGAVDGYASFAELEGATPTTAGTMGQIRRLLGIGLPATDAPACVFAPPVDPPAPAPETPPVFGPYPAGWHS